MNQLSPSLRTINTRIGVPFALPHCAAPSHHHHVDAVNLAVPSQRPASPSSRRAASSSHCPTALLSSALPVRPWWTIWPRRHSFFVLRVNLHGAGHTFRQACPVYGDRERLRDICNAWGGGGGARRVELRNQMMWSGCTLQPLAVGPNINYNEMIIKRQAYNE